MEGAGGGLSASMKARYIKELRQEGHPLHVLLKVASLARSTYYYYINRKEDVRDQWLKKEIGDIFKEHRGRYGYRRIVLELRNRGFVVNHKRVRRIMKQMNLKAETYCKKSYDSYKGPVGIIVDNIISKNFYATKPLHKCYTDITALSIPGSKKRVYLSVILDGYNSEIIAYTLSQRASLKQVLETVMTAFPDDDYKKLILHSDRGWFYQHERYHQLLQHKNIIASMTSDGHASDNAMCESFFAILKREIKTENPNKTDLFRMIPAYILYYNRYRIKQQLSGLSPISFKQLNHDENPLT